MGNSRIKKEISDLVDKTTSKANLSALLEGLIKYAKRLKEEAHTDTLRSLNYQWAELQKENNSGTLDRSEFELSRNRLLQKAQEIARALGPTKVERIKEDQVWRHLKHLSLPLIILAIFTLLCMIWFREQQGIQSIGQHYQAWLLGVMICSLAVPIFWAMLKALPSSSSKHTAQASPKKSDTAQLQPPPTTKVDNPLQHFSSRIKEVWLELHDYQFYHSPYSKDVKIPHKFLGRKTAKDRIVTLLKQTVTNSGAYLVTGFRGMGKTSLVRLAVEEYNLEFASGRTASIAKSRLTIFSLVLCCIIPWSFFCLYLYEFIAFDLSGGGDISENINVPLILGFIIELFLIASLYRTAWLSKKSVTLPFLTLLSYGFIVIGITVLVTKQCLELAGAASTHSLLTNIILALLGFYLGLLLMRLTYDISLLILSSQVPKKDHHNTYKSFEINLSQDEIGERSILRRLTQELARFWREELRVRDYHPLNSPLYFPFIGLMRLIGVRSHRHTYFSIRNRLDLLEQRLSAEVVAQENASVNPSFATRTGLGIGRVVLPAFDYSRQNQISYPIASAKEIEDQLIHIFKDIEDFRGRNSSVPRLLFIIDELDKIEPNSSTTISQRESSDPSFDRDTSIRGGNRVRQRQEAIAGLLANLKGFLNVVRAKFIFIGGREMYDASLADIADRDSFYSSIFNDVIYISSFFKDKTQERAGVTQMTVAYLCQLLIPPIRKDEAISLKEVAKAIQSANTPLKKQLILHYGSSFKHSSKESFIVSGNILQSSILPQEADQPNAEELDTKLFELAKAKVIALLQQYIIYLTYRSNGTPKKLISLIERHVRHAPDGTKASHSIVVRQNRGGLEPIGEPMFLRLKFDFQYEIGLTNNLYRPFIVNNSRYLKALGDKLLFSSAFIFDHILKFHPFGFSWRNLELIPEVILINKEPNLRQFIEALIRFLSGQYIRPTVGGVFQYKFFSKTAIELSLVSRISDLGAAAYNFTLDESLQIKRYYKRKLSEIQEKYHRSNDSTTHFVHSIAFIQTILGDLHYYDKEYDDALVYYTESIQFLRVNNKAKNITKHQFLLWLRNKLKAGLTLEKMRAFDSVFSYYRTLLLETPTYLTKMHDDGNQQWAYRGLQLVAKPPVAWLAAIEKQRFDGITIANLRERHHDITQLLQTKAALSSELADKERQCFLFGDYFNNVGSLLYYKNKYFPELLKEHRPLLEMLPKSWQKGLRQRPEQQDKNFFTTSQAALIYYCKSLDQLLIPHVNLPVTDPPTATPNLIQRTMDLLRSENAHTLSAEKSYYIANVISKIGDTVLATCEAQKNPEKAFDIGKYNPLLFTGQEDPLLVSLRQDIGNDNDDFSPYLAMRLYLLAQHFYRKAGRSYSAAFQIKKVLFCLRDIGSALPANTFRTVGKINSIMGQLEGIAMQAISLLSSTTQVANRPQVLKYQDILGLLNPNDDYDTREQRKDQLRSTVYNVLTTATDSREIIITVEEIRLRLYKRSSRTFGRKLAAELANSLKLNNLFISPYSMINSRFLRLLELKYRCEVFYCLLKDVLGLQDIFSNMSKRELIGLKKLAEEQLRSPKTIAYIRQLFPAELCGMVSWEEFISFMITEGIFCTREIIRTINLFSPGYIISYSFLADNHRRMADWCQAHRNFEQLLADQDKRNTLQDHLKQILGNNAISALEPNYHRELANLNFQKAIDMHTEGRLYKAYVLNTYALEDDFNDNFSHFCAALERYRLNNGSIHAKMQKLREKIYGSHLYQYDSYFPLD